VIAIEWKQKLLQAAAQGRIRAELSAAAAPLERALVLFEADTTGRYTGSTLETEKRTAVKWVLSKLGDARLKVRDAFAKGQITDDMIVQEIRSPNSTGNALADGWRKAVEFAVKQYEYHGGALKLCKDWLMPQSHDAELMFQAGRTKWVDNVMPMLDRSRMLDRDTNLPLTDTELKAMLEGVWDNLTSGGISKRVPSGAARSRRRTGGRRLHRCEDCSALVIVEPISARTADHAVVVAAIDVIIAVVAVEPVKVTMEMWPLPSLPWKISPPCPPRYTSQHPGDRLSKHRALAFADIIFRTAGSNRSDTACQQRDRRPSRWCN
jgi:hypothetical protein